MGEWQYATSVDETTVKVDLKLPASIFSELDVWADMVVDEPLPAVLEVLAYELARNPELREFAVRLMAVP